MGIRVKGANRVITGEIIANAARGRIDKYGNPFELIDLLYSPRKKIAHRAKTKGFEDTFIVRNANSGKITIEYRIPGSAEWLKDPIGGEFKARVARTKHNLRVLASMYYDKLWTIAQPHINEIVKKAANVIEEENKQTPCNLPGWEGKTWYDYHKLRRNGHFLGSGRLNISRQGSEKVIENRETEKDAELARKLMDIEQREAIVAAKENELRGENVDLPPVQDPAPTIPPPESRGLSLEELKLMEFPKLRKLAKDEFGVDNAYKLKKLQLLDIIMERQSGEVVAPEEVGENSTETQKEEVVVN